MVLLEIDSWIYWHGSSLMVSSPDHENVSAVQGWTKSLEHDS
jgi:hypothetical protein